jgi:hypothetical protein
MLLRIAVSKTHKIIIWTAVVIVEVYSLGFFLLFVMQCLPSRYFWTRFTGGQGSCINPAITVNATYAYSAISCAVDWTLGLLPISLVWNLQMNPRTKLSVAAILALGAMYIIPSDLPLHRIRMLIPIQSLDSNNRSNPLRERPLQFSRLPLRHNRRSNLVDQRNRNRHSSLLDRHSPAPVQNILFPVQTTRRQFFP